MKHFSLLDLVCPFHLWTPISVPRNVQMAQLQSQHAPPQAEGASKLITSTSLKINCTIFQILFFFSLLEVCIDQLEQFCQQVCSSIKQS